ncbi:unnamed protein product [Chironomus riparius]|uniref:Ubiquitin-like domain-containing protein n=1 Tax=Chironomus riparius TaxID=315576 RepID=A0A9N9WUI6_9DIPT|nr:unnamed protein product [Chironomus riparius]
MSEQPKKNKESAAIRFTLFIGGPDGKLRVFRTQSSIPLMKLRKRVAKIVKAKNDDLLIFHNNHELSLKSSDGTPTTPQTFGLSENNYLTIYRKTDLFVTKRASTLN